MRSKRSHPGIRVRHGRTCPARDGASCRCQPAYEAWVYSAREARKIRRTFSNLAEAKSWRADATVALRKGTMRTPSKVTLRQAADAWVEGAKAGTILTRSGDRYKPSAIRSYDAALRDRLLPDFGGAKLSEIQRADVQDLADRLLGQGLDPSTIRNALMPLRAIYRRAVARGEVAVNPTTGLELPAVRGRRDRIASAEEAGKLLAALPESDRALWATALYAGLRRGELLALRWEDVDLAGGVIHVERAWDVREGVVEPKSRAGRRAVPVAAALRDYLVEHKLRSGRSAGLIFGRTDEIPFEPVSVRARAISAWTAAGVQPLGLHEARHTFASLMIAAGVNAKALSSYMGPRKRDHHVRPLRPPHAW
jgi:integrase